MPYHPIFNHQFMIRLFKSNIYHIFPIFHIHHQSKYILFGAHIQTTKNYSFHGICVEQFMTSNVKYLTKSSTFAELENLLSKMPKLKAFPIVENNSKYFYSKFLKDCY